MIKRLTILCFLLALLQSTWAEVVVLQSGKTVEGEIVLENEDVVMVRDSDGRKFQFPRVQVAEIIVPTTMAAQEETQPVAVSGKGNCALRLDMSGGALWVPSFGNGGFGAVDVQIGTRQLAGHRLFLGGSVGYQAAVLGKAYNFLPLMLVVSVPLLEGKHAPELGAALGYGFAIKTPSQGGLVAKLDISWRCQYKASSAILLGAQARLQQAQVQYTETIEGKDYQSTLGRNFVTLGLRLALEF